MYRVFNPSANVPPGYTENSCDFFLIAICEAAQLYVRQYAFDVRSTAIWTRRSYDDSGVIHWQDWKQIVLATPPQEFDLPLAEGYTQNNGCKYSKDQFNVVRVTFNLSKSAGTIAGGEVVATLPAGFRPKRYWGCVAIGNNIPSDAATRHPVVVQVATNGEISASMMVETDQAELRAIVCAMEFLAAD